MRKKKQEITELSDIENIIRQSSVCHLAMSYENNPYIIPLNFGYADGKLYFHCANEGMKLEYIEKNPRVCFSMILDKGLEINDRPCNWSQFYRSVIGWGTAKILQDLDEKRNALLVLMSHYREQDWNIPDDKIAGVTLIQVDIHSMTGKHDGN